MRYTILIASALLALSETLSGCAESLDTQVKRFQTMPAPQGQSFSIRTSDERLADSLEFSHYADIVAHKLSAQGYQPASNPATASLIVSLDYGVDKGRVMTRSEPFAGYGGWGGYGLWGGSPFSGYGYYGRGWYHGYLIGYDPFFFDNYYGNVESYVVYSSGLNMKIDDKRSGQRVFEGEAKAVSSSNTLTTLVPCLIDAMFTNFPGRSGETVKITIAPPKKN